MKLSEEVVQLKKQAAEAEARIRYIQDNCEHPGGGRKFEYGADTGNWSRADDHYWVRIECTGCGKVWSLGSDMYPWAYRQPTQAPLPRVW